MGGVDHRSLFSCVFTIRTAEVERAPSRAGPLVIGTIRITLRFLVQKVGQTAVTKIFMQVGDNTPLPHMDSNSARDNSVRGGNRWNRSTTVPFNCSLGPTDVPSVLSPVRCLKARPSRPSAISCYFIRELRLARRAHYHPNGTRKMGRQPGLCSFPAEPWADAWQALDHAVLTVLPAIWAAHESLALFPMLRELNFSRR